MSGFVKYSDLGKNSAAASSGDFEKVGKVSTASVFKHTRKHWKQWIRILDRAGARSWTHQEIVAYLKTEHGLTPWWQQGVAMGFEIATGRRGEGQDLKGKYMTTATKSLPCGVQRAWECLTSDEGLRIWLQPLSEVELKPKAQFETRDGFFGEIRTVAKRRRLRLSWQDPKWERSMVVELLLVPRPGGKSIVVFNHTGIADLKAKGLFRERWRTAADRVPELLRR